MLCRWVAHLPTYWIVQTKYVGRVEERNPTRIDCVYHVGFRFALPDLQV